MKVIIDAKKLDTDEYLLKDSKHTIVIPRKFCEPVDGNIRLTEEQARELIKNIFLIYSQVFKEIRNIDDERTIQVWKEKGWIIETKTAKEELEEYYNQIFYNAINKDNFGNLMKKFYELSQKAIKEAEEEKIK